MKIFYFNNSLFYGRATFTAAGQNDNSKTRYTDRTFGECAAGALCAGAVA